MSVDRFPLIAFQLGVGEFEWREGVCGTRVTGLSLDCFEVIYVVGMGLGEALDDVRQWLEGDERRRLIFWEEDLGVIDACLKGPLGEAVFGCPQVHIHYAQDAAQWQSDVMEVACAFPFGSVEVFGGSEAFRQEVQKMHLAVAGHLQEALHGHVLSVNTLRNARHLSRSADVGRWKGSFEGVPAVICGAGPSLSAEIEVLKGLEERAVVIAGGSAIAALTRGGVEPHLALAVDPNEQEVRCLEGMRLERAPLLFTHRLHPGVFELTDGPLGFVRSAAGGELEQWLERELGIEGAPLELNDQAFSVTTLGLALAVELGCNPIVLVGVDLSYTDGKRYADGVEVDDVERGERVLRGEVETLLKWIVEAESVSGFVSAHPEITFLNATSRGLDIDGVEQVALREIELPDGIDVRGRIDELLATTALEVSEEEVERALSKLGESVRRAQEVCRLALEEAGGPRMALYECDLQEELIYKCLLEDLGRAIERIYGKGEERKWKAYLAALETVGDAVLLEFVAQGADTDS